MDDDASRYVPEYRRTHFKNKGRFTNDELRRRRENLTVDLRKQKRDEMLLKRRNFNRDAGNDSEEEDVATWNQAPTGQQGMNPAAMDAQLRQELPRMVSMLQLADFDQKLAATIEFRRILSREHNPPIDLVIELGAIPYLVEFMGKEYPDMLQLDAAWALTNIASGTSEQTRVVVEAGAVPKFVDLLDSNLAEVKEQAIWAFGNVAGDSTELRDYVLECGAMEKLLELLNSLKMTLIRTATFTLLNLCRGRLPPPNWNIVSQAIPTLAKLVYSTDSETLVDACWAVSYLSDCSAEDSAIDAIQAVVDARIPQRLVQLLGHDEHLVQTPALRAIGNIVTGNDYQTQTVINAGVLPALAPLLYHSKDGIRKEACWTISNITAGNPDQIQAVINANLIPQVIKLLATGDYKIKKEACWAISNASLGGLARPEQIRYLVQQGCIKPLCDLLPIADARIIEVTLDSLENILKMGEMDKEAQGLSQNPNAIYIEEAGGMEKIFECQLNQNALIYKKAFNIIETYFGEEDDAVDDEMTAPDAYDDRYRFGVNQNEGNYDF